MIADPASPVPSFSNQSAVHFVDDAAGPVLAAVADHESAAGQVLVAVGTVLFRVSRTGSITRVGPFTAVSATGLTPFVPSSLLFASHNSQCGSAFSGASATDGTSLLPPCDAHYLLSITSPTTYAWVVCVIKLLDCSNP